MATSILKDNITNEDWKTTILNHYGNKNLSVVAENTVRTQMDNSVTTNKILKKKRQLLQKGKFFCICGFIIVSSNGEGKGMKNMEVKMRLHKKVCLEGKK